MNPMDVTDTSSLLYDSSTVRPLDVWDDLISDTTSSFYTAPSHPAGSSLQGGVVSDVFSFQSGTSWSSGIPGIGYLSGKAIKWIGAQAIRRAIPVEVLIRFYYVSLTVQRALDLSRQKLEGFNYPLLTEPNSDWLRILQFVIQQRMARRAFDDLHSARIATWRSIEILTRYCLACESSLRYFVNRRA